MQQSASSSSSSIAPPQPPSTPPTKEEILKASEQAKQKGDLALNRGKYADAIPLYDQAIGLLEPFRGGPIGEKLAVQALSSKAQCYYKLGEFEKAMETIDFALSVPIVTFEQALMSKLYHRKGLCYRSLSMNKEAYLMIMRALSIGGGDSYGWEQDRQNLLKQIVEEDPSSAEGLEEMPTPDAVSSDEIAEAISEIMKFRGDAKHLIPWLEAKFIASKSGGTVNRSIWWDRREDKTKLNMMFAVCNVAVLKAFEAREKGSVKMKAAAEAKAAAAAGGGSGGGSASGGGKIDEDWEWEAESSPDDVLPLLEFLITRGARAEQRYPLQGNRTPLQMLCLAGATKCVELSSNYGATPYVYDDNLWTPLLVAVTPDRPSIYKSAAPIVDLLIANGSHNAKFANFSNHNGMCAVSLAAQSRDADALRSLLSIKDIKLTLRSRSELFSSVIWAKIGRDPECVNLIKDAAIAREKERVGPGPLTMEIVQDIILFDFSFIVHNLKGQYLKIEGDQIAKAKGMIAIIRAMFGVPKELESTFSSEYERFFKILSSTFYPIAAHIRYGMKSSPGQASTEANLPQNLKRVIQRLPFHISCAFNTLYLTRGPPAEGRPPPPPITSNERNDFYYLTLFDDWHQLFILSLQSNFGYFVPSMPALTKMQTMLTAPDSLRLTSFNFNEVDAKTALHISSILTSFTEKFPNCPQNVVQIDSSTGMLTTLSSTIEGFGGQDCLFLDPAAMAASTAWRDQGVSADALADILFSKLTGKMIFVAFGEELRAGEEKYERSGSFCDLDDAVRDISEAVFTKFKGSAGHKIELLTVIPNWIIAPHGIFIIEKNA